MPGTPANSPNLGIPRYADTDVASFSTQVNAITDAIDGKVGADSGLASLDASGKVPAGQLGNVETLGVGGDLSGTVADAEVVTVLSGKTPEVTANKGADNGYASLDGSGNVPSSELANVGQLTPSQFNALVQQLMFVSGDLKVSAGSGTPTGWHLCDGSAISRTTYAALFAAIGTAYGSGDGATTFNVPDYRGRTIVGAGTGSGLTARGMGSTGGEENHALAASEIPSHTHGYAGTTSGQSADHSHAVNIESSNEDASGTGWKFAGLNSSNNIISAGVAGGATDTVPRSSAYGDNNWGPATMHHAHDVNGETYGTSNDHAHSYGGNTDTGAVGNGGHNNMQPFAVANVFIKL